VATYSEWTLKARFRDLLYKLISFGGFWGIVTTLLLIFGYIGDYIWAGIMGTNILLRGAVKYKNGFTDTPNPNNQEINIPQPSEGGDDDKGE